jgi:plastocyanin
MKNLKPMLIITGLVLGAAALMIGVVYGAGKYLGDGKSGAGSCSGANHTAYTMRIEHDEFVPRTIEGKLCDTLTVKNLDNVDREIAFGAHEDHQPYDGINEKLLSKDQSFKLTFVKAGTYTIHDHLHDEVEGSFIVK